MPRLILKEFCLRDFGALDLWWAGASPAHRNLQPTRLPLQDL
jgi:hypothetical protein